VTGVPFWGKEVSNFSTVKGYWYETRDPSVIGYPLKQFAELPAGDYSVQAFLTVYKRPSPRGWFLRSTCTRTPGDGQWQWESPGNAYSQVQRIHFRSQARREGHPRPKRSHPAYRAPATGRGAPNRQSRDTAWVKVHQIQSQLIVRLLGSTHVHRGQHPAAKGYDEKFRGLYYPVNLPARALPQGAAARSDFERATPSTNFGFPDTAPRFVAVTIRDANPFYDSILFSRLGQRGALWTGDHDRADPIHRGNFRIIREPWRGWWPALHRGWEAWP